MFRQAKPVLYALIPYAILINKDNIILIYIKQISRTIMGIIQAIASQQAAPINVTVPDPAPVVEPAESRQNLLNLPNPNQHDDMNAAERSLIGLMIGIYQGLPSEKEAVKISAHVKLTPLAQATLDMIKSAHSGTQEEPLIPQLTQPIYYMKGCKATYQGDFKEGKPHGRGISHFKDGSFYYGQFQEADAQGLGIFIFKDGSIYEGRLSKSRFHGYGSICYQSNRMKYKGYFLNGTPHGRGQEVYEDGECFAGEYENGVKQGYGIYVWKNGQTYFGNFKKGLMEGEGVIKKGVNVVFQGNFKAGQKIGPGLVIGEDASCQGYFQNDFLEGPGSILWKDGTLWEGQFTKSKLSGPGKIYNTNDEICEAKWEDNQIIAQGDFYKNNQQLEKRNSLKLKHQPKLERQIDRAPQIL